MEEVEFNILIIGDNSENIQKGAKILKNNNIDVSIITTGKNIVKKVEKNTYDLILLDIMFPEINGFSICKYLKSDYRTKDIPIIFLTENNDIDTITKAFELGAVDYVTKPFYKRELKARVKTHLELKRSREQIEFYAQKLKEKNKELRNISMHDSLTNLLNRDYMIKNIRKEENIYEKEEKIFSLVLCDIDHFKKFNDKYGHDCGDYVLKELSKLMQDIIRSKDKLSRWGGEEFLFLLHDTKINEANNFCKRLKNKLKNTTFNYNNNDLKVTMTYGISEYIDNMDKSIKRADKALYYGKEHGRNTIIEYKKIKKNV
ncbi:MAG: GGDEF domain-containing response regulator [Bacillota bacterium]